MGQIEDFRLFALVVEKRSISGAAEAMNIAKSAVSRRLALLEDRFGARLIHRDPGKWEVTAMGRELYQRAVHVVGEMDEIESDFSHAESRIAGPLAVSLPHDFGVSFLMDAIVAFAATHPDIILTADFDDRHVDLGRENYDFAIRIVEDPGEAITAQKIGTIHHILCASPSYLDAHGVPDTVEDLSSHALLYFGAARRGQWFFVDDAGKRVRFDFQPALNSNSGQFLLDAAVAGRGVVRLPDFICGPALATGALVPLIPAVHFPEAGIYLLHAEGRRLNRRMRLFDEAMKDACADHT